MNLFKRIGLAVTAIAVALVPLVAQASFTPDRPTKVYDPSQPGFDHVQFNSYTGTPLYGDERYFLDAKNITNTQNGGFQDVTQVTNGETLMLRIYIHNNADPSLNASGVGIARNTRVSVDLPTTTATSLRAHAYISASNATPQTVSDSVDFQAPAPFSLSYVPGSAQLFNNTFANGTTLADSVVTSNGALVGSDALDGNWKACFQFAGYVYLRVKVNMHTPSVTFQKFVHKVGDDNRLTTLSGLNPGDKVEWVLKYQNNTTQLITNAYVRDQLPAHVTLVPGTVKQFDSNNPNGYQRNDQETFTGVGVNLGNIGANAVGSIRFTTTVNNDLVCGDNPMTNNAWFRASNVPEEQSFAVIHAAKSCVVTPVCTQNCTPVTPPVTPPATPLPQTGAETGVAGALGITGIGYSLRSYLRSKRSLLDSLRRK